jgi:NAD(P)-dependent dehydrogenase (short-subunit alcohol dehydrogenase family)
LLYGKRKKSLPPKSCLVFKVTDMTCFNSVSQPTSCWIVQVFLVPICVADVSDAMSRTCRTAILVTGSTDGIGLTTAKNVASRGYDVIIHGRETTRLDQARKAVHAYAVQHSSDPGRLFPLPPADFSSIRECHGFAHDVRNLCKEKDLQLCVLMNNAGVYSEKHIITEDGLEQTFAVNVVAPFIVTSLLLPTLLQQKSRIVIASSISQCGKIRSWKDLHYQNRSYSADASYSESKLLDAMLSMEMADRLQKAGFGTNQITCNCLDPGTVNTKMLLAGWGACGIHVEDALDQTWLCTSEEVENETGKYFVYQKDRSAQSSAYDQNERNKMWALLSELAPEAAAMWTFDWYK